MLGSFSAQRSVPSKNPLQTPYYNAIDMCVKRINSHHGHSAFKPRENFLNRHQASKQWISSQVKRKEEKKKESNIQNGGGINKGPTRPTRKQSENKVCLIARTESKTKKGIRCPVFHPPLSLIITR